MLTTSFLACMAPRFVAPAMNDRMLADAATQANLETLRERGVEVIEPEEGGSPPVESMAVAGYPTRPGCCRGSNRCCRPSRALGRPQGAGYGRWHPRAARPRALPRQPLQRPHGHRPGCRRRRRGADVTLIAANVSLPEPAGVRRIDVETAAELARRRGPSSRNAHVLPMAAAPADFRAAEPASGKLKREGPLELRLEPTEDILATLSGPRAARSRRSSASPRSTEREGSSAPAPS